MIKLTIPVFIKTLILYTIPAIVTASSRDLGIGRVAENMMQPVSYFSDFIHTACLLIGASFIFASIVKYIEHRKSPLMVPISTVWFLLIAGLVLLALPLVSYWTDSGVQYSLFTALHVKGNWLS